LQFSAQLPLRKKLFDQDTGKLLFAKSEALLVDLDVPATAKRPFTNEPEPGARAYTNIQQLTSQVLVREALDCSGHSSDKMRGGSAARKGHVVGFGYSRKYKGKWLF